MTSKTFTQIHFLGILYFMTFFLEKKLISTSNVFVRLSIPLRTQILKSQLLEIINPLIARPLSKSLSCEFNKLPVFWGHGILPNF